MFLYRWSCCLQVSSRRSSREWTGGRSGRQIRCTLWMRGHEWSLGQSGYIHHCIHKNITTCIIQVPKTLKGTCTSSFSESGRSFKVTAAILKKRADAKFHQSMQNTSESQSTPEGATVLDIHTHPWANPVYLYTVLLGALMHGSSLSVTIILITVGMKQHPMNYCRCLTPLRVPSVHLPQWLDHPPAIPRNSHPYCPCN